MVSYFIAKEYSLINIRANTYRLDKTFFAPKILLSPRVFYSLRLILKPVFLLFLFCCVLILSSRASAELRDDKWMRFGLYQTPQIKAEFEEYQYSNNIFIRVTHFNQAIKVFQWLDLIQLTKLGRDTLDSIEDSGHTLLIFHDPAALLSAGVAGAPMTRNLTNGVGENVYIKFYFDMEHHGSNCVFGENGDYIEYTALHNLFHELAHAKHKMQGSWHYFDSEGQAIREENVFRIQWARYRAEEARIRHEDIDEEAISYRDGKHCSL